MSINTNSTKYGILFLLFFSLQSKAQSVKLFNHISNEVYSLHSKVLNQQRQFYIHVPEQDSTKPKKALPVLYLLDGENHFHILSSYIDYLSHYEIFPQIIVVGIINIDRKKDLTPSHSTITYDGLEDTTLKPSGGNEQFLKFIETELMPYIEMNHKTTPYRILAGHSFGGIATINCMLTHPDMFNAYIAVSPSFWWDKNYMLKLTEAKLAKLSSLKKHFFYSDGNEGTFFHTDLLKFDSLITKRKLKGLEYKYKNYPEETHMTEPIVAYFDALRFILQDYKDTLEKQKIEEK
jgi:predicted alpha/beta superfamily hydrolase